jgi:hypothetical protein
MEEIFQDAWRDAFGTVPDELRKSRHKGRFKWESIKRDSQGRITSGFRLLQEILHFNHDS